VVQEDPIRIDHANTCDSRSGPGTSSRDSGVVLPLRTHHSAPHRARNSIDEDDLITSIDWVDQGLADCLSLAKSVLDQSSESY
jgi:hypothetical protein